MGPALVLIMGWVVAPLGKHLPGKAVPAAIEQRLLFRFRQAGQTGQVVRVVVQQRRVVKYAGGNKHPGPPEQFCAAVRQLDRALLHDGGARRRRCDESGFDPAMAHPAGVGGRPEIDPGAGAGGTVAAHHVAVLFPLKMGQLIKPDEVKGFALVIGAVFGILHRAKIDLCPAGKVHTWPVALYCAAGNACR